MNYVQIPPDALSSEALDGLIEEFVTREGTEYGARDHTLDEKKSDVRGEIDRGDVLIVFDPESQTPNLVLKEALSPAL